MTLAEAALRIILVDIASARYHATNKGGQHVGGPPALSQLPPSALGHIARICCDGLGVGHSREEIARQIAILESGSVTP